MEVADLPAALKQKKRLGVAPAKPRSIALATPTLGAVSMWWASKLTEICWPMNMGKAIVPMFDKSGLERGVGEIGEMRNRIVQLLLAYEDSNGVEVEAIFWLDDDVIVHKMALLQLAQHDRDIAAGVYFTKGDCNFPLIFEGPSTGSAKWRPNETFESWGYAQGLSLVKTKVYRQMRDELDLGTDKYGAPAWYKQPQFGLDEQTGGLIIGGTEDFYFFENASKLGIRPLVDCNKFAFGFHFDLDKNVGYPQRQWEQYLKSEPLVWDVGGKEVIWD